MNRLAVIAFTVVTVLLLPLFVQAKPPRAPKAVEISIKGMKFTPASVTIKAGQSVTWTNNDQRDHTVAANDGSFNSGNLGPGATFTYKFAKGGTYKYACSLHPRMKGEIVVR
jgi:plastocyanin